MLALDWVVLLLVGFLQDAGAPRLPVPSPAQLKEAEKLVREVLKEDYAKRGPALVKKLLKQGIETTDDQAVRFYLLKETYTVAAEVGDIPSGLSAIEHVVKGWEVDGPGLRSSFLADAGKSAKLPETFKGLAEAWLAVMNVALPKEDYALAERAAKEASALARKAKDLALVNQAEAAIKAVGPAKARGETLKAAREALARDANEPAANLALGRHECFSAGRWDVGLPLLAKGSDTALKGLAAKDLAKPTDGAEQLALGDAWWEIAEKESGEIRAQVQKRAALWYAKAKRKLSGLAKAKAEKRSEILGNVPADDVLDAAGLVGWWSFDEGKGTKASDASPSSAALTLVAGASWTPGPSGSSLDLRGGTDSATAADAPALNMETDSWTVACFVRPRGRSSYRIANKWQWGMNRGWLFDVNTSVVVRAGTETQVGAVRFRISDGKVNAESSAEVGLALEKWTHVAMVVDRGAGEARLYGGGERVGTPAPLKGMGSLSAPVPLGVGILPQVPPQIAGNAFNGSIDELRIYRRALGPEEIKTLAGAN